MKRIDLSLSLCICAFVILIPLSFFSIKRSLSESSNPATFISPVLTVFNFFLTRYLIKHEKRIKKTQYQFDPLFSDRLKEFSLITEFIQGQNSILYISDKLGIGKTLLLKETADRINSTRINGKQYHAVFIDVSNKTKISEAISREINLSDNYSIDAISKKLKSKHINNWILLIDGVNSINLIQTKNFADSMFNHCNVKSIISIDGALDQGIKLTLFDKKTVSLLAYKQGISISNEERDSIFMLSKGMPVYIRFLLNQLKNNRTIDFINNTDIRSYIQSIIENDLSESRKKLLSIICCLKRISDYSVNKSELLNINRNCNENDLFFLEYCSLISADNDLICIEKNIQDICLSYLGEYENMSYITIANYYIHIKDKKDIALLSILYSNMTINISDAEIKEIFLEKQQSGDYAYIVKIGDLDLNNRINPNIYDSGIYKSIQLEYFNALLELGLYNEAETIVQKYDFSKNGKTGIMGISNEIDFSIHYCVANLHHLTNDFDGAISSCMLLLKKCQSEKHIIDVKYLMAHCLRHKSSDNESSIKLFKEITDSKKNLFISPQTYIRACYSIVSIQMMNGEAETNFKYTFNEMYQFAKKTNCSVQIAPYIKRHEIRFIANYKNDLNEAIHAAEKELKILECNQFRIKYDYYFELAELYRIKYESNNKSPYDYNCFERSNLYYSAALEYARISKDYNLESSSILGKILLQGVKESINISEQIRSILSKTQHKGLMINYYYARFIQSVATHEKIPQDLIDIFKLYGFSNLYKSAQKYNDSEHYILKLIVM